MFPNRLIFSYDSLLAQRSTPKWSTNTCRFSSAAYSLYSQLPRIAGGRLLHPHSEEAPC
jgi:hypothetical protein